MNSAGSASPKGAERSAAGGDFGRFDLLRAPAVGRFLRWRGARLALQIPVFLVSLVMIVHAFLGPQLAPKNVATLLTWVHFRGLIVLLMLFGGNVFCMSCPFMLPRNLARRLATPKWNWPRRLRGKGPSIVLFVGALFAYEWLDLWSDPWATGIMIVGYFALAFLVDFLFKRASFCKYVCPVGQFNFMATTMSPLEVAVRDANVCADCRTKDCISGRRAEPKPGEPGRGEIVQRGCEMDLYLPSKVGNMDCTFCMDCVKACPRDNVGILSRLPGDELAAMGRRSSIGQPDRRGDWSMLIVVFVFGAALNAFAMISPVYALERWISAATGIAAEWPILGMLFGVALVVEPIVLLGAAALWTRRVVDGSAPLGRIVNRFIRSFVPLGFGVWLAHYGFHFLTGFLTVVPVSQNAIAKWTGHALLGQPFWTWTGIPAAYVYPIELAFLGLGMMASLVVAWRLADEFATKRKGLVFAPWALIIVLLFVAACWTMSQPMDMRGTFVA